MTVLTLQFHTYRYLPYERRLARLEAERLLGTRVEADDEALRVPTSNGVEVEALERLTYFRAITDGNGLSLVPKQAQFEGANGSSSPDKRPRRQSTRYSAHGLHEYRGKFNPQIVRASLNLLEAQRGAKILDPFCGSGTVLLEALHQGFDALGVDMNPLATAIGNAKLAALRARPDRLIESATRLVEALKATSRGLDGEDVSKAHLDQVLGQRWLDDFSCADYLSRWFPLPVLGQLRLALDAIDEQVTPRLRWVFRILLSDILRDVSWQDPGDLRIRRRRDPASNYPAVALFLDRVQERLSPIVAARELVSPERRWQRAYRADSCGSLGLPARGRAFLEGGVDCVLSSPPYATALPYVDTQRLSLALLDLASPSQIRSLDASLVGSREVSTRERRRLEVAISENSSRLAPAVADFCLRLMKAYDPSRDGFRRRNTPSVLYRYFTGMTKAMGLAREHLRPGGRLAFVIGPSRTTLGGQKFEIDTPRLLAASGEAAGLHNVEVHDLDTYSRYDVHSRNSIRREQLLIMERR